MYAMQRMRQVISKIHIHFSSPLLGSIISQAGPACGAGGQVIYLHAAQAEVIFLLHSLPSDFCQEQDLPTK